MQISDQKGGIAARAGVTAARAANAEILGWVLPKRFVRGHSAARAGEFAARAGLTAARAAHAEKRGSLRFACRTL